MKLFRALFLVAGLALAAGCGSDDDPVRVYSLTPGTAAHGTMTPAAPVEYSDNGGPVAITATANAGFVFAGWVATPADKAAFENPALATTSVALSGDATIAPTFMVDTADYFVNPRLGVDTAAGTTAAQPFRTITQALAAVVAPPPGPGKAGGPIIALAPGLYNAANGEVFPLVVPPGVTLIGDEEFNGVGTTIQGAGPMPGWAVVSVGLVPSTNAAIIGIHMASPGSFSMAYDLPSGGAGITLRRNTIEPGSDGGLYVQVAAGGEIAGNIWPAGGEWALVAVGGDGTTAVSNNLFQGPIELDDNHLDLGGGAGASPGLNQFLGNGMSWFGGAGTMARNNHWRHAPPTLAPAYESGPSGYDYHLAGANATIDITGYW